MDMEEERAPTSLPLFLFGEYKERRDAGKLAESMQILNTLMNDNGSATMECGLDFREQIFDEMIRMLGQFLNECKKESGIHSSVFGLNRYALMDQLRSLSIFQSQQRIRHEGVAARGVVRLNTTAGDSSGDVGERLNAQIKKLRQLLAESIAVLSLS